MSKDLLVLEIIHVADHGHVMSFDGDGDDDLALWQCMSDFGNNYLRSF